MNKNLEQSLSDGNRPQYRFMKYRSHKILLAQNKHLRANQSGVVHPGDDCRSYQERGNAGTDQEGDDHEEDVGRE